MKLEEIIKGYGKITKVPYKGLPRNPKAWEYVKGIIKIDKNNNDDIFLIEDYYIMQSSNPYNAIYALINNAYLYKQIDSCDHNSDNVALYKKLELTLKEKGYLDVKRINRKYYSRNDIVRYFLYNSDNMTNILMGNKDYSIDEEHTRYLSTFIVNPKFNKYCTMEFVQNIDSELCQVLLITNALKGKFRIWNNKYHKTLNDYAEDLKDKGISYITLCVEQERFTKEEISKRIKKGIRFYYGNSECYNDKPEYSHLKKSVRSIDGLKDLAQKIAPKDPVQINMNSNYKDFFISVPVNDLILRLTKIGVNESFIKNNIDKYVYINHYFYINKTMNSKIDKNKIPISTNSFLELLGVEYAYLLDNLMQVGLIKIVSISEFSDNLGMKKNYQLLGQNTHVHRIYEKDSSLVTRLNNEFKYDLYEDHITFIKSHYKSTYSEEDILKFKQLA